MATGAAKKRSLPPKVAQMRARKRLKLQEPVTNPLVAREKPTCEAIVRLDKLQWKEVALPDHLDDYEGFFGLEELSDVEVVKEESGKTTYRRAAKVARAKHTNPSVRSDGNVSDDTQPDQAEWSEEDWTGFSSDECRSHSEPRHKAAPRPGTLSAEIAFAPPSSASLDGLAENENLNRFSLLNEEVLGANEDIDLSSWVPLSLAPPTLAAIERLKFSRPTPIQSLAIPEILLGHDVIGKASTGSGKTLAFGIPILEHFISSRRTQSRPTKQQSADRQPPTALILSPTRELAHQLHQHLTSLCSSASADGPQLVTVTGGLSTQKQQRLLEKADIVIATPGRLWEIIGMGRGTIAWLQGVKFLVLDEADRLLSEGHFKEVEEIINALDRQVVDESEGGGEAVDEPRSNSQRQTLVFSATFSKDLQRRLNSRKRANAIALGKKESLEYLLHKLNFREEKPKFIDANPVNQMASGLQEGIVECPGVEKDLYLYSLLMLSTRKRTLVFTNSISAVRRLTPFLCNLSLSALPLHSQMVQKSRLRSVERFSASESAILVATDVAARGLDIDGVQLVIHYHVPRAADMYVHRSGRTARAEDEGKSVLLCAAEEVNGVRRLVAKVHSAASGKRGALRSLSLDPRVVSRLRRRVVLAKQLADVEMAKEKARSEDQTFLQAAEDLGVDYDSEEFETNSIGRRGRGKGRERRQRAAREVSKSEAAAMRAELKSLLAQRVNIGVSERYIAGGLGGVDMNALLERKNGDFLGLGGGLEDGIEGW